MDLKSDLGAPVVRLAGGLDMIRISILMFTVLAGVVGVLMALFPDPTPAAIIAGEAAAGRSKEGQRLGAILLSIGAWSGTWALFSWRRVTIDFPARMLTDGRYRLFLALPPKRIPFDEVASVEVKRNDNDPDFTRFSLRLALRGGGRVDIGSSVVDWGYDRLAERLHTAITPS